MKFYRFQNRLLVKWCETFDTCRHISVSAGRYRAWACLPLWYRWPRDLRQRFLKLRHVHALRVKAWSSTLPTA